MTKPVINDRQLKFPGDFELWLFSQNWLPRFCCDSPKRCKEQHKNGMDRLGVHGLWPAYVTPLKTGETFPSFCHSTANPGAKKLIGSSFALHEWKKHGSCSTLHPQQYFNEASRVEKIMSNYDRNKLLAQAASETLITTVLQDKFGGPTRVAIRSNKYCQLTEITTCFERAEDGMVGEQIVCPDHVLAGSRNSAITIYKCNQLAVDTARDEKCMFITAEILRQLKKPR